MFHSKSRRAKVRKSEAASLLPNMRAILENAKATGQDIFETPGFGQLLTAMIHVVEVCQTLEMTDGVRNALQQILQDLQEIIVEPIVSVKRWSGTLGIIIPLSLNKRMLELARAIETLIASGRQMMSKMGRIQRFMWQSTRAEYLDQVPTKIHYEINQFLKKGRINPMDLIPWAPDDYVTLISNLPCPYKWIDQARSGQRLSGAQENILQSILSTLSGSCDNQIVWLQGAPQSGKSTIAGSIASRLNRKKQLAASLAFCPSKQKPAFASLVYFVNRIADQLSRLSSHFTVALGQSIESRGVPNSEPISEYFYHMLLKPLASVPVQLMEPWVMVLDGSEIPSEASELAQVLPLLSKIPIRFLITSRLHPEIDAAMAELGTSRSITLFSLDDIPAQSVERDLELVIRAKLEHMHGYEGEVGWPPTDQQIRDLIALGQTNYGKVLAMMQQLVDKHSAGVAYHKYLDLILQDISISQRIFAQMS